MTPTTHRAFAISSLFTVTSGDFHAVSELDPGKVPLVSCGDTNNGVVGLFDIPAGKTYERCLTVAYTGSWPLLTKFHPYHFGAKDDVGVLTPLTPFTDRTLLYIAAVLSREAWRYSYGRKCYLYKIPSVEITLPCRSDGEIDEVSIAALLPREVADYIPSRAEGIDTLTQIKWSPIPFTKIFELDHGDFNSYKNFPAGAEMIVGRSADNNGVVGYYDPPEHARRFPVGTITVSTVTGDAFVQVHDFYASDKVVICAPKTPLRVTSLFFIAFAINHQRWRYSYGRSCFKRTLGLVSIDLPVRADGELNEDAMGRVVQSASYWATVRQKVAATSGTPKPD